MKLYEVTVRLAFQDRTEQEVWEIRALDSQEARRIATSRLASGYGGRVLSVKDTLFRSAV